MSDSNKLLISGSGVGNPNINTAKKYTAIGIIVILVGCIIGVLIGRFFLDQSIADLNNAISRRSSIAWTSQIISEQVSKTQETITTLEKIKAILAYGAVLTSIGGVIAILYVVGLVSKKIKSTHINVYDDKIKGVAVNKDFSITKLMFWGTGWDKAKLTGFDLAINQITTVDLDGSDSIIINASGTSYKCFVSNGSEIQGIINNKIRNK